MTQASETAAPPIRPEVYISVDVETAGANPARFAMLSIGACLVDDPTTTFYVELKPDRDEVNEQALAISGLSMLTLAQEGIDSADAMLRFEAWVHEVVPEGSLPIFVGFNAAFDWMFVDDYFQRYLDRNPFGHTALDIKAYSMGMLDSTWGATSLRVLSPKYLTGRPLAHNALADAQDQAELFRALRSENAARTQGVST
ncbi:MAG: 3'-5' exonuclease [Actinomycetota bacterium]|nr:3'-5' exonuclease [Actinomycetota bacterium]